MAVYFLLASDVNRVKIGTAVNPEDRVFAIRKMCPVPVKLLGWVFGGRQEELEWHDNFAHLRRYGEWFEYTPELAKTIWWEVGLRWWNSGSQEWRQEFLRRS